MNAGGWFFMVVCWAVLTGVTFWCFKLLLGQK